MSTLLTELRALGWRARITLAALALGALLLHLMGRTELALNTPEAPWGILSLETARQAERVQSIIEGWSPEGRAAARSQVLLDYALIVVYVVLLWNLCMRGAERIQGLNRPRLVRAARRAAVAGVVAGVADALENTGMLAMLATTGGRVDGPLPLLVYIAVCLKFLLIGVSLAVGLFANAVCLDRAATDTELSWASMLRTARAVVATLALTGLALLVPPQTEDMLTGLSLSSGDGFLPAAAFHIALAGLALSAWYWSRTVLSARLNVEDSREAREELASRHQRGGRKVNLDAYERIPHILFYTAAAIGMLSALRTEAWEVAVVVLVWAFLGREWLRHRVAPAASGPGGAAGASHAGGAAPTRAPSADPGLREQLEELLSHAPGGARLALPILFAAILAFLAGTFESFASGTATVPNAIGRLFPGPSAALLSLGLAIGPLTALTYVVDRVCLGGRFFGISWSLSRPPVFIAILAVILIVPSLVPLHSVRVVKETAASVESRATLAELFEAWRQHCAGNATSLQPVIVAISGGASRAGLWGARVLREVDARAPIFAISSVSGGSLGTAAYMALLAGQKDGSCRLAALGDDTLRSVFEDVNRRDALGPLLSGSLFGDIPRALFGLPLFAIERALWDQGIRSGDRADALERAFERNWSATLDDLWPKTADKPPLFDSPFLDLHYRGGRPRGSPIWIANGTDAKTGGRLLTAPFSPKMSREPGADVPISTAIYPFPGAEDVLRELGADVPISTAIHNTARFPFLSPAGELLPASRVAPHAPLHIIDGGYFENSGLTTALDLARWLEAHGSSKGLVIRPILVLATSDAESNSEGKIPRCDNDGLDIARPRNERRPNQAIVPLLGLYSVRGGHSAVAIGEARRRYCADPPSFFHFYLYPTKNEYIPLNWVLSEKVAESIWNTMGHAENACESQRLEQRLSGQPLKPCAVRAQ